MIRTITQQNFIDYFNTWHGGDYKNKFTYDGKISLFNYLVESEYDMGKQTEFDIVAISCDFSEYENLQEIQKLYDCINNIDDLRNHTEVIEIPNTTKLIIQDF